MLPIGELPGSFAPSMLEIFAALGIAPYLWQFTGSVKRTFAYTVLSAAVALSLSGSLPLFPALFCAASVLAAVDWAVVQRRGGIFPPSPRSVSTRARPSNPRE